MPCLLLRQDLERVCVAACGSAARMLDAAIDKLHGGSPPPLITVVDLPCSSGAAEPFVDCEDG